MTRNILVFALCAPGLGLSGAARADSCLILLDDGSSTSVASVDLGTGESTVVVNIDGLSTADVSGLHAVADQAFVCASGELLSIDLVSGEANSLGVGCSAVGPGEGGALVATALPDSLSWYAGDPTSAVASGWTNPGGVTRFATDGARLYASWHYGSSVGIFDPADGSELGSLVLEGYEASIWGMDLMDGMLYVLGDARDEWGLPHIAAFDAETGLREADLPIELYAKGEARGLDCSVGG